MPRWLPGFKRQRIPERSEASRFYRVTCICGELVTGARIPRFQQSICRKCGEPLFVLPENPYPEPPPPPEAPTSSADLPDGDESDPTGNTGDPDAALKEENSGATAARLLKSDTATGQAATGSAEPESEPFRLSIQPRQNSLGRLASPFRIAVATILAVVVSTAWLQLRSRNIAEAQLDLAESVRLAWEALHDEDFVSAEREFGRAAEACRLLRRTNREAAQLEQLHRESLVVNQLSPRSLYDVLDAAAQQVSESEDESKTRFRDQWFVCDTFVTAQPAPNETDPAMRYFLEYPMLVDNRSITIDCTSHRLDRLDIDPFGQRVVVAAQIAGVFRGADGGNALRVSLQSDSVIPLTSLPHLQYLTGVAKDDRSDPRLAAVLEQQARSLGVAE